MTNFNDLVQLVRQLREPVSGCPWDIKQTPESLIPNFIEEMYETVEAIEDGDDSALLEELGDLLLHVVFQAQIAAEEERFSIDDVLNHIVNKLHSRHPHVFGDLEILDAEDVKKNWEQIKKKEKKERKSILDGIPRALPALITAHRIQEKAAAVGFDWPDTAPIMAKLDEERTELDQALLESNQDAIKEELGDMLFTLVNLARKLQIDAESALRGTIAKFRTRFNRIEDHYQSTGEDIHAATLEELDRIWETVKKP